MKNLNDRNLQKEIAKPDDLQTEADYLRLWTEVSVEGVRVEDDARKGLGHEYLEDLHPLFEYDGDFHDESELWPLWVAFPAAPDEKAEFDQHGHIQSGLVYQAHARSQSPFLIRRKNDQLFIEKNGIRLVDIAYFPRPRYLDRRTSDGTPAGHLVAPVGSYWLTSAPLKYCYYFKDGEQCRFCNIADAGKVYKTTLNRKETEQIAEAFAIAWEDGHYRGLSLCGGSLPGVRDQDQYLEITRAIKALRNRWDDWNDGSVPVDYLGGAPKPDELHKIDEIKAAGVRFLQLNLEIGDPKWFEAVCPGKARAVGHDNWIHALEYATGVFGKTGRVRSHLVAGIEPAETLQAAVKHLAEKNVLAFANPWKPTPGSLLEDHRAPKSQWYFDLYRKVADIYADSEFDFWDIVNDKSPRFFDIGMTYHFWRVKLGIKTSDVWKIAGKKPEPAGQAG